VDNSSIVFILHKETDILLHHRTTVSPSGGETTLLTTTIVWTRPIVV